MSRVPASPATLLAATALTCLAAVGVAVFSQRVFDMLPCPWCVLQRLIFLVVAAVCVLGLLWRSEGGRRGTGALLALLGMAGAAAALWQHFVAAASASCNQTLADRIINGLSLDALLPDLFQPMAMCSDPVAKPFGIPYEFYSLALFVLVIGVGVRLLSMRR